MKPTKTQDASTPSASTPSAGGSDAVAHSPTHAPTHSRTGAQILCEALLRQGADTIFGIPGGAIMIWDSLRPALMRPREG